MKFKLSIVLLEAAMLLVSYADPDKNGVEDIAADIDPNENPNAAMQKLRNVTRIEDFINLMVDTDGNPMTHEKMFNTDSSGKRSIRGRRKYNVAEADVCSLRNVTVEIPMPTKENQILFPECTSIQRCGGCVGKNNKHVECTPRATKNVRVLVVLADVPHRGSTTFVYNRTAEIVLERHFGCYMKCTLDARKCGSKKHFRSSLCDCQCKRRFRCRRNQQWSSDTCSCECRRKVACCPAGQSDCGVVMDKHTCECTLSHTRQYGRLFSKIIGQMKKLPA